MPDWLTHVLFAWALWNFVSLKFNTLYRGISIAGSLLPDINKMDMIIPYNPETYLYVFHTPVGGIIASGILSLAFFSDRIKQAHIFLALSIGVLFHLLLDLVVKSMDGRVMIFFPFSFESYSFNIFAQEDFTFLYLAVIALSISFIVRLGIQETKV